MLLIGVIWFKRRRYANRLAEPDSNSSERGIDQPLLQQRNEHSARHEPERPSFVEVFNLVERINEQEPDSANDQGTMNLSPDNEPEPDLAKAAANDPGTSNLSSDASTTPSNSQKSDETRTKIWPEIPLMPDLEPKLPCLIVENSFQFEAALLVQICQIHLWASQRLHDSAFTTLADFGKTLIAVNANPTSENGMHLTHELKAVD